jgi:hypothetical protein
MKDLKIKVKDLTCLICFNKNFVVYYESRKLVKSES